MAAALTGCVIVGEDGMGVKYKKKCNYCGWIDTTTGRYRPTVPGCKLTSAFYCPKCKKNNKLEVQG